MKHHLKILNEGFSIIFKLLGMLMFFIFINARGPTEVLLISVPTAYLLGWIASGTDEEI